ncbi:MAG: ATPase, T2SS/T4P/T4SS family [Patescibacteria group bacterium]
MSNITPLLTYLHSHQLIDGEIYDMLASLNKDEEVRQALVTSGVLQKDELEKLESFISAMPVWRSKDREIDPTILALVPYELASLYRVLSIDFSTEGLVLLTDQAQVEEELYRVLEERVAKIYRIDTQRFDAILARYHSEIEELIRHRISSIAKRVRTTESYGSFSQAFLFPNDYKREIAEDISSLKLLQELIALGDSKCASRITLRTEANRLRVFATISQREYPLIDLPHAIAYALYLKLRYLSDTPLDEVEEMQEVIASGLDKDNRTRRFRIAFVPHSQGISCSIEDTEANPASVALVRAGLDDENVYELVHAFGQDRGMLIISGLAQSGKSFVLYRVAQAIGAIKRSVILEAHIEYDLNGIDQLTYSKRPDKDIQAVDNWYDAIILAPLYASLILPAYNLACRKWLVGIADQGVASIVRGLLAQGVRAESIARVLTYNLITHRFSTLNTDSTQIRQRTLKKNEIESIERYLSLPYFQDYVRRSGESIVPNAWADIVWKVPIEKGRHSWFNWRSAYHRVSARKDSYSYARALMPLGEVIADSQRSGESFVQFEHTLKRAQKEYLLPRALLLAYQGKIAIDEVLSLLHT